MSGTKAMILLPIGRSHRDASNGGLCSSNGLPGPELISVIGKIDQLLIDLSILGALIENREVITSGARQDASNETPHASQLPASLSIN